MAKRYGTNDDLVGFITDETEEDAFNKEQVLRGLLRERNRKIAGIGQTPGGFVIPAAGSGSGSGSKQFKVSTVSVGPGGVVGGGGGPVAGGGGGRPSVPYTPPITPPPTQPPIITPPPNITYPGGTTAGGDGYQPPVTGGGSGYSDSGYSDSGGGTALPTDEATDAEIQRLKDEVAQEEALQQQEEGSTPTTSAGGEQIIVSEDEAPKPTPKVEETNPIKRFFDKLKNLFK